MVGTVSSEEAAAGIAIALGIGLLMGIERERRKGEGAGRRAAGVRSFALVALAGALAMIVGDTAVLVLVGAGVVALSVAAYVRESRDSSDPGLTSEIALVVAFLLGALAVREPALAAGTAVAVTILLAARSRIHVLVRRTLTERELHDALLFAAAALVVLPLVPDRDLGPAGAFNPFTVWRLVVIVMALNAAGYVAMRLIGPRAGLLVAGFIGGFISSTATVATMGSRAAKSPSLRRPAVAAAVVSTVATIVLLAVVLGAVSTATLEATALPLALAGVAALGYAALVGVRVLRAPAPEHVERGRPFDLRTAVILAVTVSAVLVASAALQEALGQTGIVLAVALGGLADSQSAAASAASLVAAGKLDAASAVVPVMTALTTNTLSKAVIALVLGKRAFAWRVWIGLALVLVAAWIGAAIELGT